MTSAFADRPAEAHARDQGLGERAQEDDAPVGVEALEGRQRLALEAQRPVGRVLDHEQVEAVRELQDPVASLERERDAHRVVEVGHEVEEPRARGALQDGLEIVGVDPVLVRAHRGVGGLAGIERDHGAEEGGVLGHHDVARVQDQLGGEVEALLGALEDEDLVEAARDAVGRHPLGDPRPQRRQPVGDRVLHDAAVLAREQVGVDGAQLVDGEQVWRGVAAAERDDRRVRAVLEELADGGGPDDVHPARVADRHPRPVAVVSASVFDPAAHSASSASSSARPATSAS